MMGPVNAQVWFYRWMDEEQIDALCRKALEEDRPVESWAIARCGSWRWNEPLGEGLPAGIFRVTNRGSVNPPALAGN
jgi:hypothetical protein